MKKDERLRWFNFKTGEFELIENPTDFTNYIPQSVAAQGLYKCLIELGNDQTASAIMVLEACAGITRVGTPAAPPPP